MIDYLIYILIIIDFAYPVLLLPCMFTNEDEAVFNLKVKKRSSYISNYSPKQRKYFQAFRLVHA